MYTEHAKQKSEKTKGYNILEWINLRKKAK